VGTSERLEEVRRAAIVLHDYARSRGLEVRYFDKYRYPALIIGFPEMMNTPVMLMGHFDVVEPEPDDSQFDPYIEGDYLYGRGSADMKTVVATYMVWMKDRLRSQAPRPGINLMLVGNEENGETEAMGSPHLLHFLLEHDHYQPELCIAGERTGERGNELFGEICLQNRGLMRLAVTMRGSKEHSGISGKRLDLVERFIGIKAEIEKIAEAHLTLAGENNWVSQIKFPFVQVGNPGIFNITADVSSFGIEIRSIPQDRLGKIRLELEQYCQIQGIELQVQVMEDGVACNPENPYLQQLIQAYRKVANSEPVLGNKLPGTSARFAPGGQGIVWGQSGVGPHSSSERHFIPSITPYYRMLDAFGNGLSDRDNQAG